MKLTSVPVGKRRTCVSADVTSNEGEVLVRWNFSDGTHYTMGLGSADTVASIATALSIALQRAWPETAVRG